MNNNSTPPSAARGELDFDFIKLIHDSGGRANRNLILRFHSLLASELAREREEVKKLAKYIQAHSKPPIDIKEEFKAGWFLGHFDGLEKFLLEAAKKVSGR